MTPTPTSHLTKIINISIIAIAGFGICSCTSQSEIDFAAQHGFKRSDYFGNNQNKNFVPAEVKNPDYYTSDRKIRMGRPGY